MNQIQNGDAPTKARARTSYTGSRMTELGFNKAWNYVGILQADLLQSGSFIKQLSGYARGIAGRDKVDISRQEMILRDLYKERYGQSLNKLLN